MAAPYSCRFMSGRGGNRRETFTVPTGKRAVILHLVCLSFQTSGQRVTVFMHGIPVIYWISPSTGATLYQACRFTIYQGETCAVEIQGIDCAYGLDGWLLDDPAGRPDDADNVIVPVKATKPTELPAPAGAA